MDHQKTGKNAGCFFYNVIFSILYIVFFAYSLWPEEPVNAIFVPGILGLLALNITIYLVNLLAFSKRPFRFILNVVVLVLWSALNGYYIKTKHNFDYAILAENLGEVFYRQSLGIIVSYVGTFSIAVMVIGALLFMLFEVKFAAREEEHPSPQKWLIIPTAVVLYAAILLVPMPMADRLTFFIKSAYGYHTFAVPQASKVAITEVPATSNIPRALQQIPKADTSPHIFLIMIESFNAKVIGKRSPSGKEYTPYFNKLRKEGLYVEEFYANSIQTSKGQFATIMSAIPSIKGKGFIIYQNNTFRSVAQILSEFNYETIFFQAYEDLDFDNTGTFIRKNGYKTVMTVYDYLKPEDRDRIWGWGPEDQVLYEKFFDFLDAKRAKEGSGKPIFATLATISNHHDFGRVPENKRHIAPKPKRLFDHFGNSIHLSDMQLRYFFENLEKRDYLKNSVVIITADHSWPLGDHGIRDNELGFYEESFKVPFVMIWKGHIQPETIKKHPYSQLDIAPTLLDIVGILESTPHHFAGQSMFRRSAEQHDIFLVQPYAGKYVGVVDYPFKFVKSLKHGEVYLFDLGKDPEEQSNLFGDPGILSRLREMENKLQYVYDNERSLEANLLLPRKMITTADTQLPEKKKRAGEI